MTSGKELAKESCAKYLYLINCHFLNYDLVNMTPLNLQRLAHASLRGDHRDGIGPQRKTEDMFTKENSFWAINCKQCKFSCTKSVV